ncbi:hypothetical protein SIL08_01930 [Scandinavium sp. V105_16]|uniref:Uncharacterized protein n=1 Tax=Scandinavium lactucae TaxID=3095028 RepID=A0AAJ2VRG4_9ENTR|nr:MULTISPECIES: hypothetical protein [unclassified Scandinavium]MDX6019057.1 hypothetical protein [Scandinavium sp. V105_16]MDX6029981.1 hypothetical protein [Scandinavium sp. V105_12]MDX6039363.1 hypothetical protein [Scandinavium sp. V105_6]MDX6050434.1 hypothetical protein [Scandinavium sp. V105_1]
MNTTQRMGLTEEQSANSFSEDELSMLCFGNTKQENAYRELLAYRKRDTLNKITQSRHLQAVILTA